MNALTKAVNGVMGVRKLKAVPINIHVFSFKSVFVYV